MENTSSNEHVRTASPLSSIVPSDELLGVQHVRFKDLKIDDLNDCLDLTHNRYIQSVLPDNQVARRKAAEIGRQVEIISCILEKARQEVILHAKLLKIRVKDFQGIIVEASEQWYENGDLTAITLTYSDLCGILEKNPIKDSKCFYEYLCRTLTAAARAEPSTDELPLARKKDTKNPNTFADKVLYLVEALSHMPNGVYYAFHAYALLASKILRPYNPRCKAANIPAYILESELRRLAEGHLSYLQLTRSATYQTYHLPAATDLTLAQRDVPNYFDFATCARVMAVEMRKPCMRESPAYDHCHHVSIGSFLQYFQQRAYGEIKTKVFLSVGTLLPVELTEMVFEDALRAEEMPVVPMPIVATPKYWRCRERVAKKLASGELTEDPHPMDPRRPMYDCQTPTSGRW